MTSNRPLSNRTPPSGPILYRPNEVAKKLGCSEWWIKEQARKRRIPYSWIGGRYLFTDEHINAIVAIFEELPVGQVVSVNETRSQLVDKRRNDGVVAARLQARTPKRAQAARARQNAA